MTMQRQKGVALWSQIAEALAQDIAAGAYAIGDRLPPEAQLAEFYGANRHTIRRALDELSEAHIIRTEHGRGSFVAEDVLDYRIGKRPRFSEWVRSHNRTPIGQIIQLMEMPLADLPEPEIAAGALELSPTDMIILLERLGAADDRPMALSRHMFPSSRLPGLLAALQANSSVTAALAAIGVDDYIRRWTRVSARNPTAHEAKHLRMARTDPVLTCDSLNTTAGGVPTEFGLTCYPAQRVQLVFEP
jgi:GntR family phosphonate transport system transcriptional regulator